MAKVLIPLAKGFEDIEAVTVIDILRRGGIDVVTASLHEAKSVLSAHGVKMEADALLVDVAQEDFDAIVLPGGGEGTENLKNSDLLYRLLRRQSEAGHLLCAICAAPTVLVDAGVLSSEIHVTCYPTCQMDLDRPWAPAPAVVDGNVITAQAPGSAMLFALLVLQALSGEVVARKIARGLVTDVLD